MDWEWYNDGNMVRLFIHMLLRANHKDVKWRGITIFRGQFVSGRKKLSEETGLSEQQIRTCLKKLESTSEITIKKTNKYTVYKIKSWDKYQLEECSNQQNNQQVTSNQPTSNQQVTTNKNEKNEKNDKKYIGIQDFSEFPSLNLNAWKRWISYKKQIKNKYKTLNGEIKQIKELIKISRGDKFIQEKIIQQSIDREWRGLFPLATSTGGNQQWSLF